MENIVVSLVLLVFAAYVAFHLLVLTRLIGRGAAPLVITYAILRLLTLPLIAVGALLSLLYPQTQLGRTGIALLIIGAAVMIARLIIGGIWTSRRRRTESETPEEDTC